MNSIVVHGLNKDCNFVNVRCVTSPVLYPTKKSRGLWVNSWVSCTRRYYQLVLPKSTCCCHLGRVVKATDLKSVSERSVGSNPAGDDHLLFSCLVSVKHYFTLGCECTTGHSSLHSSESESLVLHRTCMHACIAVHTWYAATGVPCRASAGAIGRDRGRTSC